MSPIRRQGERIERPEKSIGTAGALRSDAAEAGDGEKASGRSVLFKLGLGLGIVLALLIAGLAAFAAYHWAWGDDARDIQGTWYVNGTSATISIGESDIVLTDEVSYVYEMDSFSKTLSLRFGSLSGGGCYRFSLDRGELAIVDGEYTWVDSFASDLAWVFGALLDAVRGKEALPAEGGQVTLLTRALPGSESVEPTEPSASEEPVVPGESGEGASVGGEADSAEDAFAGGSSADSASASASGDAFAGSVPQDDVE